MAGFEPDARSYRPAAQILAELGVSSVTMLTGNSSKAAELSGLGIKVSGTCPLELVSYV